MKKNCLVSVVLAVYNGEKYLEEQIASLTRQTYRNIEIIIIDDSSKDASVRLAQEKAKTDDRVKIYKNPKNLGLVPNFLKGVSLAKGEFICFCDQDDCWRSDKIDILARLLQRDSKNMLAYSDLEICDDKLERIYPSFWRASGIKPKKGYLRELSFLKNITPGCSMMFRKEVKDILALLPPEAPFMHDHLTLIMSASLGRLVYTREALVKYRQHRDNNIGAFYDSTVNNEKIIKELHRKVVYFKKFSLKGFDLDLHRLLLFCDCLQSGGIFERLSFMDCYLFLRNDTFLDKALGAFECLFPRAYGTLKALGSKKEIYAWLCRILFLTWSIVVLAFFTNNFVLYKFSRFLTWAR